MGHYVYKYVYNGEIIYIGKNDTILENRINQHKLEDKFKPFLKADIYYIELANSIMSDVVESELIRRYKPKLNVAKMSDWSGLEFVEPEWKLFIPNQQIQNNKKVKYEIKKFIVPEYDNHIQNLQYIYKNKDKVIVNNESVYFYTKKEGLDGGYTIGEYKVNQETGERILKGVCLSGLFILHKQKSNRDSYCYMTKLRYFKEFINDFETIPIY